LLPNIFKAPITKCVNNYEAGAWESLEAMKEEVNYVPMIRIIEIVINTFCNWCFKNVRIPF